MAQHLNATAAAPNRTVILGAGGFVGSEIAKRALARNWQLLTLGRGEVDLMTDAGTKTLAAALQPGDSVVLVSAKAPCKNYGMFLDNITMVKNALDALIGSEIAHLINISSDAVYSDSENPLTEDSVTAPDNLHGMMHRAREVLLACSLDTIPFGTLRPTLIYGANDPHNGYGPNRFRRMVKAGETIKLFGHGEEQRDHISVLDVAELAIRMLEHRTIGVLNAATGRVASFMELANLTNSFSAAPVLIENLPRPGPMPHNGYRAFDPSGVKTTFPDFTFTALEDGLHAAYDDS